MQSTAIFASLLLLPALGAMGQGSLVYQTTLGVGKERYVFLPSPTSPTVPKDGGTAADYAGFSKVEGTGYYAELWWAPGEERPLESLTPVPASLVTFRIGTTAGLINGKAKLEIPSTFGGDIVTLQLRVWNNREGTVKTWEEATLRPSQVGASNLFHHELSGVDAVGTFRAGTGSIANGLTYFSLTIPEPSASSLLGLAIAAWACSRLRENEAGLNCTTETGRAQRRLAPADRTATPQFRTFVSFVPL